MPLLLPAKINEERQQRIGVLRQQLTEQLPMGKPITLEIGCGHGDFLVAYAQAHQQDFCLGFDMISKRVAKSNRKGKIAGVANLMVLKAEATELLEALPQGTALAKIFVLFPDPWPKRRQNHRRLIQEPFLNQLASLCVSGAYLYFRTDHDPYFQWVSDHIDSHPRWQCDKAASWPFECASYFQKLLGYHQSLVARYLDSP